MKKGIIRRTKMKFPGYFRETPVRELTLDSDFLPIWIKQSLPTKKRMWQNRLKAHLNRHFIYLEN